MQKINYSAVAGCCHLFWSIQEWQKHSLRICLKISCLPHESAKSVDAFLLLIFLQEQVSSGSRLGEWNLLLKLTSQFYMISFVCIYHCHLVRIGTTLMEAKPWPSKNAALDRVVKSSRLPVKIAAYLVSIGRLLCLSLKKFSLQIVFFK